MEGVLLGNHNGSQQLIYYFTGSYIEEHTYE